MPVPPDGIQQLVFLDQGVRARGQHAQQLEGAAHQGQRVPVARQARLRGVQLIGPEGQGRGVFTHGGGLCRRPF